MPNISIYVPHTLSTKEALRRIQSLLNQTKQQFAGNISNLQEKWNGDTGTFSFKAMSFSISGSISVKQNGVDINGQIPMMAMPFKGKIEGLIREQASALLGAPEQRSRNSASPSVQCDSIPHETTAPKNPPVEHASGIRPEFAEGLERLSKMSSEDLERWCARNDKRKARFDKIRNKSDEELRRYIRVNKQLAEHALKLDRSQGDMSDREHLIHDAWRANQMFEAVVTSELDFQVFMGNHSITRTPEEEFALRAHISGRLAEMRT